MLEIQPAVGFLIVILNIYLRFAEKFVKIYIKRFNMKFDVILHKEDNGYWAEVPALKGCFTQGSTIDEVKENVKEAITAWLSVDLPNTGDEIISVAL